MKTRHPLETIRQAVSSGEFGRAELLWRECAAGLAEELSDGRLSAARWIEVGDLVAWARTVVLCERAQLQNRLNGLHVAGEYELQAPQPAGPRLVSASF